MLFFLIFIALIFTAYFIAKKWGNQIFNYIEKHLEDFLEKT
jgi:hypothetical protein